MGLATTHVTVIVKLAMRLPLILLHIALLRCDPPKLGSLETQHVGFRAYAAMRKRHLSVLLLLLILRAPSHATAGTVCTLLHVACQFAFDTLFVKE